MWIQMSNGWYMDTVSGEAMSPEQYQAMSAPAPAAEPTFNAADYTSQSSFDPLTGAYLGEQYVGQGQTLSSSDYDIARMKAMLAGPGTWQEKTNNLVQQYGIESVALASRQGLLTPENGFTPEAMGWINTNLGPQVAQAQAQSSGDVLGSLAEGAGIHAGNIAGMYQENPEMLLTAGAFGPVGSGLESQLWNTEQPASNALGQPSAQTYQEQAAQGIDTDATSWMNNVGAAIGAAAIGAGLTNALGAGAAPTYETAAQAPTAIETSADTVYAGGSPGFDEATGQYRLNTPQGSLTPYASDAELQAILDSAQTPTMAQGTQVAQASPVQNVVAPQMPAAVPEVDPTFGGALQQTGTGVFQAPIIPATGAGGLITPTTAGTVGGTSAAAAAASQMGQPEGGAGTAVTNDQGQTVVTPGSGAPGDGQGIPDTSGGGAYNPNVVAPGSALSRILDGSATGADWTSFLGTIGGSALGAFGAHEQASALRDIAGQEDARIREMMTWGAPSRARFEASMAPGFDITQIPGLQQSMDVTGQTLLRQLSAQGGNPYGNPGGLAEVQKYLLGNIALPAVQGYQGLNAGAGGLVQYAAGAAQGPSLAPGMGAAQANQGIFGALGYGLGRATQPNYGYSGWSLV